MGALGHKLALYRAEMAFALTAPSAKRQRAKLIWETLRFHARNGLKAEPDALRRMALNIEAEGRKFPVILRPDDGDLAIFYEIFVREAYRIDPADVPPEDVHTIVDAGANIGLASLYLAARYRKARIISIEPNPDNHALMKRNTAIEPRIVPVHACVTGVRDQPYYIDTAGRGSHFQVHQDARGVPVRGMSLDQIREAYGIGRISLLKMDIEGAEKLVFAHPAFLAHTDAIVIELHPGFDMTDFTLALAPFGLVAKPSPFAQDPGIFIATRRPAA